MAIEIQIQNGFLEFIQNNVCQARSRQLSVIETKNASEASDALALYAIIAACADDASENYVDLANWPHFLITIFGQPESDYWMAEKAVSASALLRKPYQAIGLLRPLKTSTREGLDELARLILAGLITARTGTQFTLDEFAARQERGTMKSVPGETTVGTR